MDDGYLHIITGPMFSSKTTTLINEINILKIYKKNILVINSNKDSRVENNYIQNHNNCKYKALKVEELDISIIPNIDNYDTIIIDEAQFFNKLVEFVNILLNKKMYVIVAGLNGDANQQKFGYICDLLPICNKITKLSAVCSICNNGTPGDFMKKTINNTSKEQIIIGGADKFITVCRKHL